MKLLLTMILSVIAADAVGLGLENTAVRRAATSSMLMVATEAHITPIPIIPIAFPDPHQINHHIDSFSRALKEAMFKRTDILQDYIELLHNPETNIDNLSTELYEEMARTATLYVNKQKSTNLGRFNWTWSSSINNLTKLDNEGRKNVLQKSLQAWAQTRHKLRERENYDIRMGDVFDLLQEIMSEAERELANNFRVFYQAFPQLNTPLLASETAPIRKMAAEKKLSYSEIISELELEIMQASNEDNGIDLQQNVHLVDIFSRSKLIEMIKNYYALGEKTYTDRPSNVHYLVKFNIVNMRNSAALHALNMQKEWQVTWEQLRENRTLVSALGEFIQTMDLDWPTFGQLVYPQDEQAAAQLITEITREGVDIELIVTALRKYRDKLQDNELIAHTDALIADLPYLFEKNFLLGNIAHFINEKMVSEDNKPNAGLEGDSPRGLLIAAVDEAVKATGRWKSLGITQIKEHNRWYMPTVVVGGGLKRLINLTEEQMHDFLTLSVHEKILIGEIFTAQEIEAVRQVVTEEKVEEVLSSYGETNKQAITQRLQYLPLSMQLESFVLTLAKNLNSDDAFLQALQELANTNDTENTSMFAPLALTLLKLHKPTATPSKKSKRRKKRTASSQFRQVRNTLLRVAAEIKSARSKYVIHQEQQEQDITTQQQNERNKKQRQLQAQQDAERQAQQDLEQNILSLAKKIGRNPMPASTPIWLRLRVLLVYMEINSEALTQRAAMKSVDAERFDAMVAQDALLVPTAEELDYIKQALMQHTLNREKRGLISTRQKNMLLENMERELEALHTLANVFATWSAN